MTIAAGTEGFIQRLFEGEFEPLGYRPDYLKAWHEFNWHELDGEEEEIEEWLRENVKIFNWRQIDGSYYILHKEDAMLFKLTWM